MIPPFFFLTYLQGPRHKLRPVFACSPRGPASDVGLTSWRSAWSRGGVCSDSLSKSLITLDAHPMLLPRDGKGPSTDFPFLLSALRGQSYGKNPRESNQIRETETAGQTVKRRFTIEHQTISRVKFHSKSYHSIHKLDAALQLWPGVTVLTE